MCNEQLVLVLFNFNQNTINSTLYILMNKQNTSIVNNFYIVRIMK